MTDVAEVNVRAWLARRLKQPEVSDNLWAWLVDGGYVDDAQDTIGRSNMLRAAGRMLKVARSEAGRSTPPGRKRQGANLPAPTDYAGIREQLVADHLTALAAATPQVRGFRADILGGVLLDDEQATAFLQSEATCLFTPGQFRQWKIPVVGHLATGVDDEQKYADNYFSHRRTVFIHPNQRTYSRQLNIAWKAPAAGASRIPPDHLFTLPSPAILARLGKQHDAGPLVVWPGSILDKLRVLSDWLADTYQWDTEEAAWFVLTGTPPRVPTLRAGYETPSRAFGEFGAITLTVAPWVPADAVLRAYRQHQRTALGGDNRPVGKRGLTLFRFVRQHRPPDGQKVPWREVLRQWNNEFPQWRYDDVRRLARDHDRVERALMPARRHVPAPVLTKRGVANVANDVAKPADASESR